MDHAHCTLYHALVYSRVLTSTAEGNQSGYPRMLRRKESVQVGWKRKASVAPFLLRDPSLPCPSLHLEERFVLSQRFREAL